MGLESPNNLTKVIRVRQEKELKKHEADKDRDQSQNQSCAVRQKDKKNKMFGEKCMDYMSLNEAAHKWRVIPSEIEKLCFMGLIPNVEKVEETWMIPADTQWPIKYQVESNNDNNILPSPRECPLLLMTDLYCVPGSGDDLVMGYKEQPQIALFLKAQLDFFRGEYDLVYTQIKSLMSYPVCFDV